MRTFKLPRELIAAVDGVRANERSLNYNKVGEELSLVESCQLDVNTPLSITFI